MKFLIEGKVYEASTVNEATAKHEEAIQTVKIQDFANQQHQERRERIATAALQGLLSSDALSSDASPYAEFARDAVRFADALIAELDKETER